MNYSYKYPRPSVTVDAIVIAKCEEGDFILLIQRGKDPYVGKWALPGGFIEMDEELENSCVRELEEETGLTGIKLTQFKTYGGLNRDPRGRTISIVYWGTTDRKLQVTGMDDAARAEWFPLDDLPELAFDHQRILGDFGEYYIEFVDK